MKEVFKKILKSNAYNLDGVANCLASLAENEGINNILKICVNGIENWNINANYLAEYINTEYYDYKNPIVTNIVCDYVYNCINVNFNYNYTRYYKHENADYYEDSRKEEEGEFIYKKTFVNDRRIKISYNDYFNFVNKHHPNPINELKEEV